MPKLLRSIAFLLLAAGCGGAPTAPAPYTPLVLSAGSYTLTMSPKLTLSISNGVTLGAMACIGSSATSMSVPVEVTREGAAWVVRPESGTLTLRLVDDGARFEGSIEGTSSHAGMTASIDKPLATTGSVVGSGPVAAAGDINGSVAFSSASSYTSCSSNGWTLFRR